MRVLHPFGLEHGAMAKLVMWRGEKRTDRAVDEQRGNKPCPHLLREQIEGDAASCRPEAKMTERHEQAARVIGCHQTAKDFLVDGTSVPADLQRFADLAHRRQFHVLYGV